MSNRVKDQVDELNEQLEKLERRYRQESGRIRENPDWSAEAKKRKTAELWAHHKQSWQRAAKEKKELLDKALKSAQRSAFGLKEKDPAARLSFRDAIYRISDIEDGKHLAEILERAQRTGDEEMLRALTLRAYEMEAPDLLEATLEGRDGDYRKYMELVEISEIYNEETGGWGALPEEPLSSPPEDTYRYPQGSELQESLTRAMGNG